MITTESLPFPAETSDSTADGEAFIDAAVQSPERLAALRATGLLDSAAEPAFDRLTELAVKLLRVPAAFLSLVDADRDFYKAAYGFGEPLSTERALTGRTFCHYSIGLATPEHPLVIPDTRADEVYKTVPTVESLGVAAYVGVPLVIEGQSVGSFCVIDSEPRAWTETELEVLRELTTSAKREIELRMALEQAQSATEDVRRASSARDDMLGVVTHDLRDPLHTILMSGALLLDLLPEDATFERKQTAIIRRAAERANRLIEDLLDARRIESGRITFEFAQRDLASLAREAIEQYVMRSADLGIALQTGHLSPVTALVDHDRILQVLGNLISNALKFTPRGGRVTVSAGLEDGAAIVSVADTGRGIHAEHLPRLFDPYWQADRGDRRGVGLGLPIVKGLIEAHGGSVEVYSDEGVGTTFKVILPLVVTV